MAFSAPQVAPTQMSHNGKVAASSKDFLLLRLKRLLAFISVKFMRGANRIFLVASLLVTEQQLGSSCLVPRNGIRSGKLRPSAHREQSVCKKWSFTLNLFHVHNYSNLACVLCAFFSFRLFVMRGFCDLGCAFINFR